MEVNKGPEGVELRWFASLPHGENGALRVRHDSMCGRALQMGGRADVALCIADAENNQIRLALFRECKNPFSRLSVFHHHLGTNLEVRIIRDSFVKMVIGLGHGKLELLLMTAISLVRKPHYMEEEEARIIFPGQRNGIGNGSH